MKGRIAKTRHFFVPSFPPWSLLEHPHPLLEAQNVIMPNRDPTFLESISHIIIIIHDPGASGIDIPWESGEIVLRVRRVTQVEYQNPIITLFP